MRLSDLRGRWVLVFFYPADFTPGCTAEACSLNDSLDGLQEMGATVIGVSSQDRDSHSRFQQRHGLLYPLAADTDRSIAEGFGVPGYPISNKSRRVSFLVDPEGRVAAVWPRVSPRTHAQQVLAAIRAQ
jgi:peroxiredoxin Q/BCP